MMPSNKTIASLTLSLLVACQNGLARGQDQAYSDPISDGPPVVSIVGGIEELPAASSLAEEAVTSAIISAEPEPEVIKERYANRRVKTEREVVQDADQNYINHGKWKMWDPQGNVLTEGRYEYNERSGVWTRIYRTPEAKLLTIAPFSEGQMPLVSQANFKDGELHGKWVIYDANKRKLCEWEFRSGRRDGLSTWWYAGGAKMREIRYTDGSIDGELNEWDRSGKQVTTDVYDDGRRLAKKVEYYRDRSKKSEGTVLYPRLVLDKPDDWFECSLATYSQEGEAEKHGEWVSWYTNGQKKLAGNYEHDVPTGEFVWWHDNGQKSLLAQYRSGKKHGNWTWWHDNGQRSIQGEYIAGTPSSKWLWWKDNGRVAQRADFSDPKQRQILAMPSSDDSLSSPSATKPTASVLK